jgi:hypothetical protein
LGLRQGATENATVVGELLGDLMNRGLDLTEPRLYVLDGGKALHAAVKKYAGESAALETHRQELIKDLLHQKEAAIKAFDEKLAKLGYDGARSSKRSHHKHDSDGKKTE